MSNQYSDSFIKLAKKQSSFGKSSLIFLIGLILGLLIAIAVAMYITNAPVPILTASVQGSNNPIAPISPKLLELQTKTSTNQEININTETNLNTNYNSKIDKVIDSDKNREQNSKSNEILVEQQKSSYILQFTAHTSSQAAEQQKALLAMLGYMTELSTYAVSEINYYRLHLGPFDDFAKAQQIQEALATEKISALITQIK